MVVDSNTRTLMNETAGYEIIGRDAEIACFKIYHGDHPEGIKELAKEKVIKSNLRFVLKFAIDYHRITGLPIADFVTEGKLGLMEAFYKFDYTAGVKFGSYAVWYVRTCMSRIVNEHDLIRVPVRLRAKVLDSMRKGNDPTTMKYGAAAKQAMLGLVSLDQPLHDAGNLDTTSTIGDLISYEDDNTPLDDHAAKTVHERIERAINSELTEEERTVVRATFGIGEEETSLGLVAAEIGTSKEWARRIKARALSKLRDARGFSRLKEMA